MATVKELIERYNAEEVGGRLIATVDGKREYIADIGSGGFMLTEIGLRLEHDREQVVVEEPVESEKPKRKKKADADVASEDVDFLASLGD